MDVHAAARLNIGYIYNKLGIERKLHETTRKW